MAIRLVVRALLAGATICVLLLVYSWLTAIRPMNSVRAPCVGGIEVQLAMPRGVRASAAEQRLFMCELVSSLGSGSLASWPAAAASASAASCLLPPWTFGTACSGDDAAQALVRAVADSARDAPSPPVATEWARVIYSTASVADVGRRKSSEDSAIAAALVPPAAHVTPSDARVRPSDARVRPPAAQAPSPVAARLATVSVVVIAATRDPLALRLCLGALFPQLDGAQLVVALAGEPERVRVDAVTALVGEGAARSLLLPPDGIEWRRGDALAAGVRASSGSLVVFVHDAIELAPGALEAAVAALHAAPDTTRAIVGGVVTDWTGAIAAGPVTMREAVVTPLRASRWPRTVAVARANATEPNSNAPSALSEPRLGVVAVDELVGASGRDARLAAMCSGRAGAVAAVRWATLGALTKATWDSATEGRGIDTAAFPDHLFDIDLSLARAPESAVCVRSFTGVARAPLAPAIGLVGDEPEVAGLAIETLAFADKWRALLARVRARYNIDGMHVLWSAECGVGQALGFTVEALTLVHALETRVSLALALSAPAACVSDLRAIGTPPWALALVRRLSSKTPAHLAASRGTARLAIALVLHHDPGRYASVLGRLEHELGDAAVVTIGRSMFETTRVPAAWVTPANTLVDELWVPSAFGVDAFAASGVRRALLHTVPEAIDTSTWDPMAVTPARLAHRSDRNLLATYKHERRKGWNVLVRAFAAEFDATRESVALHLRVSLDAANEAELVAVIANATRPGRAPPRIHIVRQPVRASALPAFVAAFDGVVQPTRGEGFGLPIAEAMSMAKAVIATNFSGCAQLLAPGAAFPLSYTLVESGGEDGHMWAEPSERELGALMRRLVSADDERRAVGRAARERIVRLFSLEPIGDRLVERLRALRPLLVQRLVAPPSSPPPPPPSRSRAFESTLALAPTDAAHERDEHTLALASAQDDAVDEPEPKSAALSQSPVANVPDSQAKPSARGSLRQYHRNSRRSALPPLDVDAAGDAAAAATAAAVTAASAPAPADSPAPADVPAPAPVVAASKRVRMKVD